MQKFLEKAGPSTIGLVQSLIVVSYCALIAGFFYLLTKSTPKPGFFGFFLILALFVFSAAVTGTIVFGYPAYLALFKHKISEAISILMFTLLCTFALILIITIIILTVF